MRISRLLRAAAVAGVAAMAFVANPAALATALTYTVTVDPFVVGSDAGTVDVTNITITNPNTYAVEITSITPSFIAHNDLGGGKPGNANDKVTAANLYDDAAGFGSNCFVSEILSSSGGSCTVELALTVTGAPPTSKTGDNSDTFGMNQIKTVVNSEEVGHTSTTPSVTAEFLTQVDLAPEPGSLVLLGSGMLGLAGIVRRKMRRS